MASSNSENETDKRPQFGTRFLSSQQDVFKHNAWDNVTWDEEQETEAWSKTQEQHSNRMPLCQQEIYETDAPSFWDQFYGMHQNRFFKDRHWLFTEFPELSPQSNHVVSVRSHDADLVDARKFSESNAGDCQTRENENTGKISGGCHSHFIKNEDSNVKLSPPYTVFEVGCGAGNTVFPVLETHPGDDFDLMVYCCDFSKAAIDLVKSHRSYDERRCHAFVCDITADDVILPFPDRSVDVIVLIFVLSAIHPDKMQGVAQRLAQCLKPGGLVLFRDYGRYDMAQLRFKSGSCLSENFYVRGDGTRVYFFTQDDIRGLFTSVGLVEEQNVVDRRLQVNRGRQLKMYRVWVQCKYRAPSAPVSPEQTEVSSRSNAPHSS